MKLSQLLALCFVGNSGLVTLVLGSDETKLDAEASNAYSFSGVPSTLSKSTTRHLSTREIAEAVATTRRNHFRPPTVPTRTITTPRPQQSTHVRPEAQGVFAPLSTTRPPTFTTDERVIVTEALKKLVDLREWLIDLTYDLDEMEGDVLDLIDKMWELAGLREKGDDDEKEEDEDHECCGGCDGCDGTY
ncbi:hypothetical protein V8F20_004343 [Naviculisporaceae sp. PSN 640]